MNRWFKVISCIILCHMAGVIGSFFMFQSIPTWYAALTKPWFTPTSWFFGPVWLTLFTLMGISLYWILEKGSGKAVLCIILCQMAGIIGSVFTYQSIPTWYEALIKPWFTPPSWLFGPVWLTLFTLMGISLYWVLQKGIKNVRIPIAIFASQLILNALWSFVFFGLRNPLYGLIDIVTMWILIATTIVTFYKVSKKAGIILVPYLVWVTIATLLNYYVLVLNA